jgi:hypothetical protein
VVWNEDPRAPHSPPSGIYADDRLASNGLWQPPVELDDPNDPNDGSNFLPVSAINASGQIVVAWGELYQPSSIVTQVATRDVAGGPWSAPKQLTQPADAGVSSAIAAGVLPNGTGLIEEDLHNGSGTDYMTIYSHPTGGEWAPPLYVAGGQEPNLEFSLGASIATDDLGDAMTTWTGQPQRNSLPPYTVQEATFDATPPSFASVKLPTKVYVNVAAKLHAAPVDAFNVNPPVVSWAFSDGTAVTNATVTTHTFHKVGTAKVTITATDRVGGNVASRVYSIKVVAQCVVPKVVGLTVKQAKAKLARAHCALGRQHTVKRSHVKPGVIVAQAPKVGRHLAAGARVAVTVARR